MPSQTFENLNEEKKDLIRKSLIKEFKRNPLHQATVKNIVEDLKISRGSFYQYFTDLADSYLYILKSELIEIHQLFIKLYMSSDMDFIIALEDYGKSIAKEIYHKGKYQLYKNRFLYWNPELDRKWKSYPDNRKECIMKDFNQKELEKFNFIKAVIHKLIERLFIESWSEDVFLSYYKKHIHWIKRGINHDEFN